MAIHKIKDGATFNQNIQEFVCDEYDDLATITNNPDENVVTGSVAYIIDDSAWYMKSTDDWVLLEGLF